MGPEYEWRLSFCCDREGCRRRTTPPSVRYLGRRVYLGAVVVLVTALQAGITPARARRLVAWLGVSGRTVQRWRTWWRTTFVTTAFWRAVQGHFLPPVAVDALPASLRARFAGPDERVPLARRLRLLSPLTTTSVSRRTSLAMVAGNPQTMPLGPAAPRP